MKQSVKKAIIPAAGLGTRFLPATKSMPKEMLPIVDVPSIQYIVEEAVKSGIKEILIITNPYKKCIEDHFDKTFELEERLSRSGKLKELEMIHEISEMVDLFFVRQKEPKGLG
ncbi:MAG: UTP--glucose-1-phosphate uridylyltransferase, partial [Lachnospiraceae bacterium]|nr:UTP--glucose-1-phosphate uridylyltransferase [Lachnospiraceae bacterium]